MKTSRLAKNLVIASHLIFGTTLAANASNYRALNSTAVCVDEVKQQEQTDLMHVTNSAANINLMFKSCPNSVELYLGNSAVKKKNLKGNAKRVGEYISILDPLSSDLTIVLEDLGDLENKAFSQALEQMQPAQFEALNVVNGNNAYLINSSFAGRLETLRDAARVNYYDDMNICSPASGWMTVIGDFLCQKKMGQLSAFDANMYGVALGFDSMIYRDFVLGVAGAYTHTNLHWKSSRGKAEIESGYVGVYGGNYNEYFYVDGALAGFFNHYQVDRHIKLSTIDRTATNSHKGIGFSPHLGVGFYQSWCDYLATPFMSIDYTYVTQDKYTERKADGLNLRIDRNTAQLFRLEGGLNIARGFDLSSGGYVEPSMSISYVGHKLISGDSFTSAFQGFSQTFKVVGDDSWINQVAIGFALRVSPRDYLNLVLSYDARLGSKRQEQEVALEMSYRF